MAAVRIVSDAAGERTERLPSRRPFEGIAGFYAQYRPAWPDAALRLIVERFGLDATGRLLDLGCGPGSVILPLARDVDEAVGIDPEPDMLSEARVQAARRGATNVTWLQARAEELADAPFRARLGRFRLVTMGASFHWMDREAVLAGAYEVLVQGGGLVIIEEDVSHTVLRRVVDGTLEEYLGGLPRHPARPVQRARHEAVVARSRFTPLERAVVSYRRTWDVAGIIGWVYSFSHGAYVHLGDRRADFEERLRERLYAVDPRGDFSEDVGVELILAWKT